MTTIINGVEFDQHVREYDPSTQFSVDPQAVRGRKWPRTSRGSRDSAPLSIVLPIINSSPNDDINVLQGLCDENDVLLIEANQQNIYGNTQAVYFRVADYDVERQRGRPTFVEFHMTGEVLGVPKSEGGTASRLYLLGGRFTPAEHDVVYFPMDDADRKGVTPEEKDGGFRWVGRDNDDWSDVAGSWNLRKDDDGDWTVVESSTSGGDYLTVFTGNTSLGDGTLQASVKLTAGDDAGLIFRSQGTGTGDGAYYLALDDDKIELFRRTGDDSYTSIDSSSVTLNQGKYYDLAITGDGSDFYCYLDGELQIIASDSNHSSGRIGLASKTASADPNFKDVLFTEALSPKVNVVVSGPSSSIIGGDGFVASGNLENSNPGFEDDSDGDTPSDWTVNSLSSATVDDGQQVLGNLSVNLSGGGNLAQTISVNQRQAYVLEGWVRPKNGTAQPKVEGVAQTGDGDTVDEPSAQVASLWQKVRTILEPSSIKNTGNYEFRLTQDADGAHWDYATFRRASPYIVSNHKKIVKTDDVLPSAKVPSPSLSGISGTSVSGETVSN